MRDRSCLLGSLAALHGFSLRAWVRFLNAEVRRNAILLSRQLANSCVDCDAKEQSDASKLVDFADL